ncbi:rRNA maturation RNase YbeY [Cardinium endosymbiont of Culicoides punctatus]|uniref:rRNA maturation RNase YbeY n=1 Tax=Cardinium endosymbiont of Culicoides punctatus TaxID=2304601 RepID=UPI0010586C20|nr:rRNA maturation RNase YbeY [Cardinium endosymbiont of Culicoides punctatus]TDG95624.1 Endoribonuclease YbeY [Cardinium endosymbiont of Culicoides punctatus]
MHIYYFSENIGFSLKNKGEISIWLQSVIEQEQYALDHLNFIFCSDNYLHAKNKEYLGHDTLTDVITFDYTTTPKTVLGDIYISIDRVRDNAQYYKKKVKEELYTVMVHGVLHLLAYDDQTEEDKLIIREKESFYINQLLLAL